MIMHSVKRNYILTLGGKDSTNAFVHRFIAHFAAVFWCCASTFRSAFFHICRRFGSTRNIFAFQKNLKGYPRLWTYLKCLICMIEEIAMTIKHANK